MGFLFYTYWVFLVLVVKECRTQKDPFFLLLLMKLNDGFFYFFALVLSRNGGIGD